MTQEEKQILLKDLCARLPYGLIIEDLGSTPSEAIELSNFFNEWAEYCMTEEVSIPELILTYADNIKPYLRPMSTMTEDEKKELLNITAGEDGQKYFTVTSKGIQSTDELIQYGYDWEYHWLDFSNENITTYSDWLNAHHFDYRGLIEKGLALEAQEGMYD